MISTNIITTTTSTTITIIIITTSTATDVTYIYWVLTVTVIKFSHILTYLSSYPPSDVGIIREVEACFVVAGLWFEHKQFDSRVCALSEKGSWIWRSRFQLETFA